MYAEEILLADYDKAIAQKPEISSAYWERGKVCLALCQKITEGKVQQIFLQKAIADFQYVIRDNPLNELAFSYLQQAKKKLKILFLSDQGRNKNGLSLEQHKRLAKIKAQMTPPPVSIIATSEALWFSGYQFFCRKRKQILLGTVNETSIKG